MSVYTSAIYTAEMPADDWDHIMSVVFGDSLAYGGIMMSEPLSSSISV